MLNTLGYAAARPPTVSHPRLMPGLLCAQRVLGAVVHHPGASSQLPFFTASRVLFERVLRERLLAAYSNVKLRYGSVVEHLQHGGAGAEGYVRGARLSLGLSVAKLGLL